MPLIKRKNVIIDELAVLLVEDLVPPVIELAGHILHPGRTDDYKRAENHR